MLREDYSADNFVPGPLLDAMRSGGFLYVEEFNRAPEDTLNTLLTAMAERRIAVPRVGTVEALPSFRVVASMNPYDTIGTTRLSTSVTTGCAGWPSATRTRRPSGRSSPARTDLEQPQLIADAVALTRATREHEAIRQGSSVRGAIDLALVVDRLARLRGDTDAYPDLVLDGMLLALSGRIHLDEVVEATPEDVLRSIWESYFVLDPARGRAGLKAGRGRGAGHPAGEAAVAPETEAAQRGAGALRAGRRGRRARALRRHPAAASSRPLGRRSDRARGVRRARRGGAAGRAG